jgi:hypothetical protein
MYASTSSINCKRTRAVNHRFVSRPFFILSSFSPSSFITIKSNPISNRKSQPSYTAGTRRPLPRAREFVVVVRHPSIARTFALGTPVSTAAVAMVRSVASSRDVEWRTGFR